MKVHACAHLLTSGGENNDHFVDLWELSWSADFRIEAVLDMLFFKELH